MSNYGNRNNVALSDGNILVTGDEDSNSSNCGCGSRSVRYRR